MKEKIKHFLLLTVSTLIMAVGTYFFKFTNNFTFGGITGLAVLVADKTSISASDFSFIVNMLLLILGFIVLGKKFAAKTAYCSILLSVVLSTLERVCPMDHPLTDQTMLELCFAIALPALGSAILFNIGSSSGGTDIQTGLYSFLGLTIRSFMIDNFIEGFNLSKYFNVVCDEPEAICDFLVHELNRSATVVHAQGAFSGKDKYIVFTVLSRPQAVRLRNYIKENQPSAFMLISNTSEIIGKGFHSI